MRVPVHDGRGPVPLPAGKDPDAVKDYRIAWGDWLRNAETIDSSQWISDGVFTIDSTDSLSSETIGAVTYTDIEIVWLSGGVAGQTGFVTNRIVTNQGRTEDRSFKLLCQEQ